MTKINKVSKKASLKKNLRKHVSQSLEEMLKNLNLPVRTRKFKRSIKKASKLLVASVKQDKLDSLTDISESKRNTDNGVVPTHVSRVPAEQN